MNGSTTELRRALAALACSALVGLAACHREPERRIEGQTVTVGCAHCVFHMEGVQGCPWAVEIGDEHFFLLGSVPPDHDSHAEGGICTMPREAVVDGVIHGDRLIATRVDLLPFDPHAVPSSSSDHASHAHVH